MTKHDTTQDTPAVDMANAERAAKIAAALRDSSFVGSLGLRNGMTPEAIEKTVAAALGI